MSNDFNELSMIYQALSTDATIQALVPSTTYTYAIFNSLLIPEIETATETINFYNEGNFSGGEELFNQAVSINCRATEYSDSRAIATAVYNVLNRNSKSFSGNDYFNIISILPTIPPADSSDVYNTPISVQIRRR